MTAPVLDFFGCRVEVRCAEPDRADLAFFFGPHLLPVGTPAEVTLDLVADNGFFRSLLAKDQARKAFTLRRDGVVLARRDFRDWSGTPSPLPPFTLLADRVCLVQATVLTRAGRTVAMAGSPYSGKTSVGLAMARRGWSFVSDQLLVVERASADVLPYCVPVGLRGTTLAAMRAAGLVRGAVRSTVSAVSGEVLLVRPETLATPVPVTTRLRRPVLVRVRRTGSGRPRLTGWPGGPMAGVRAWPDDAHTHLSSALGDGAHAVLGLPPDASREYAAELVERHCD